MPELSEEFRKRSPDLARWCDSVDENHENIMQMLRDWKERAVNPDEVVLLLKKKIDYLGHLVDDMVDHENFSGHSDEVVEINTTIKVYREVMWLLTSKSYFESIRDIYKTV